MKIKPGKVICVYSRFRKIEGMNYLYCGATCINRRKYRILFSFGTHYGFYKIVEDDWLRKNIKRIKFKEDFPKMAIKYKERFEAYTEQKKEAILRQLTPKRKE